MNTQSYDKTYVKVPSLTWTSIYATCQQYGYKCIELVMVTKYPVNNEHIIGFSEITQTNINVAMVLYHYHCAKVTLTASEHPSIISDDDWQWLLPHLQQHNLLNHDIYMFYRSPNPPPHIEEIEYHVDSYHVNNAKIYVYNSYIIRMWYMVNDVSCPTELQQLLSSGAVNGIYIRQVTNGLVANA